MCVLISKIGGHIGEINELANAGGKRDPHVGTPTYLRCNRCRQDIIRVFCSNA